MSAREARLAGTASAIAGVVFSVVLGPAPARRRCPARLARSPSAAAATSGRRAPRAPARSSSPAAPQDDRWPRWSPEGNRIAVVRDGDLVLLRATARSCASSPHTPMSSARLAGLPTACGSSTPAARAGSSSSRPRWPAPTGRCSTSARSRRSPGTPAQADQIAYTDGGSIFTVRPDGSSITELIPPDPDGRTREELAWDPQSGHVVFMSTGPDGTRIEGAGVSLDGAFGVDRSPAWSPTASRCCFHAAASCTCTAARASPTRATSARSGSTARRRTSQPRPDLERGRVRERARARRSTSRSGRSARRRSMVAYQTVAGAGSATEGNDYAGESGTVGVRAARQPGDGLDLDPRRRRSRAGRDVLRATSCSRPIPRRLCASAGRSSTTTGAATGSSPTPGTTRRCLGVFALDPFRGGSERIVVSGVERGVLAGR